MDNFMDQLSEKLTAQEIIRANQTAEIEELGEIKKQVQELKDCTAQMQELVAQMQEAKPEVTQQAPAPVELGEEFDKMRDELFQLGAEFTAFEDALAKIQDSLDDMEFSGPVQEAAEAQPTVDISGLEASLVMLESNTTLLGDALSEVKDGIAGVQGGFAEVKDEIAGVQGGFAEVKDEIAGVQGGFAEVKDEIAGVQGGFAEVKDEIAGVQGTIAEMKDGIAQLQESLAQTQESFVQLQSTSGADKEEFASLREELNHVADRVGAISERSSAKNAETMDAFKRYLLEKLEQKKDEGGSAQQAELLQEVKTILEEMKVSMQEQQEAAEKKLSGVHESIREGVHKECVKVYRNIREAMGEENEKQSVDLKNSIEKMEKKATLTMIFAATALVASLAGVALQVLTILHIL